MIALSLLLALQQQPQTPPGPAPAASPIAHVTISPATRTMTAGDTLRFSAQAVDSAGSPVPNTLIRFVGSGGRFEGKVDSTGLVSAGSTGVLGVTAIASVPGTRPVLERMEIAMQPGPAASVTITPEITRLVTGQRFMLTAAAFSARGDKRADKIRWRSSAPRVADVAADGLLTASAPGRATITASVEGAKASFQVEVLAITIGSLEISPARVDARQGDVHPLHGHRARSGGQEDRRAHARVELLSR